jgi:polar amino acid transport system permease protein
VELGLLGEYLPVFAQAAWLTLGVGLAGVGLSVAVGALCAAVRHWRVPLAGRVVSGYTELARNTPLVVQLFFLYFGLPKVGIVLSSAACAVIGLAFLGGAYMSEAFRAGIQAVPVIQSESALSLGLSRGLTLTRVVLPQAMAFAMPAVAANTVFLIKETSVVSIVALPDLMFVAKDLIGADYNTAEALTLLVAGYLVIVLPLSLGAARLESKVRGAVFGN